MARSKRSRKPKKKVFIDFDGVIHNYQTGWRGPTEILDGPVIDPETGRSSIDWLTSLLQSGNFQIHIYSRRAADPAAGGIPAMGQWLVENGLPKRYLDRIVWETGKPDYFVLIDDRCHRFDGSFPEAWDLEQFRPWNRSED